MVPRTVTTTANSTAATARRARRGKKDFWRMVILKEKAARPYSRRMVYCPVRLPVRNLPPGTQVQLPTGTLTTTVISV